MGMYDEAINAAGGGLGAAMGRAFELEQFELHYQPQVHIGSGAVVGMEALIRWHHPQLGLLGPAQFLSVAKRNGMIVQLAEWVLRHACRQNHEFIESGVPPLKVSVNLSALEFRHSGLVELVRRVLGETGLSPALLDLEVSESLVLGSAEAMMDRFHRLQELGVGVSVDDCGTGYAGTGHFMSFPLHQVKIDRSFVRGLPGDARCAAVARSIVNMGASLGIRVLAVGVETAAQIEFLRGIWCEYSQGNYYTEPLPAHAFAEWVRRPAATRAADPASPEATELVA